MRKETTPQEALAAMQALCARSEQAVGDIRNKLYRKGLERHDIDSIVDALYRQGFLDDLRYARAFCHDKHEFNRWGKVKIEHQLRGKGLSDDAVTTALAELDSSDDETTLLHLLRKKADTLRGRDPRNALSSLMRFAASRGYTYEQTTHAIERLRLDLHDN